VLLHRNMTPIATDRHAAGKRRHVAVSGGFALLCFALTIIANWPAPARAEIDPFIEARRVCRTLLPAFAEQPIGLVREPVRWLDNGLTVIVYQWSGDRLDGIDEAGWLACWFLPMKETGGRWQIDHLETSAYGVMTRYDRSFTSFAHGPASRRGSDRRRNSIPVSRPAGDQRTAGCSALIGCVR
jgi:hypothetical protein